MKIREATNTTEELQVKTGERPRWITDPIAAAEVERTRLLDLAQSPDVSETEAELFRTQADLVETEAQRQSWQYRAEESWERLNAIGHDRDLWKSEWHQAIETVTSLSAANGLLHDEVHLLIAVGDQTVQAIATHSDHYGFIRTAISRARQYSSMLHHRREMKAEGYPDSGPYAGLVKLEIGGRKFPVG